MIKIFTFNQIFKTFFFSKSMTSKKIVNFHYILSTAISTKMYGIKILLTKSELYTSE